MIRWLIDLSRRRLLRNILGLYAVRFNNYLLPLIVIPFLSRVLGPSDWGQLAVAQALAMWGVYVIQYGFPLSGTRAVARERHRPEGVGEIVAGILGAQAFLALAFLAVAAALYLAVPAFRGAPALLGCAAGYAVVHGLMPTWYFTAREHTMLVAGIDGAAKLSSLIAILLLVRGPGDSWKVLAIYGLTGALAAALAFAVMLGETRPRWPSPRLALGALRDGASLGVLAFVGPSLTQGSAVLLGALLPSRHVAFFVAAEKLCQPVATALDPINAALMARFSHLVRVSPDEARRMAGLSLALMLATGAVLAAAVAVAAPWLVPLVFGPGYEEAVPVLRVLALTVPLTVISNALASQRLIPHGLDRWVVLSITAGAIAHLTFTLAVVPLYGALGMAWVVVIAQALVLVGFSLALGRYGLIGRGPGRLRAAARPD